MAVDGQGKVRAEESGTQTAPLRPRPARLVLIGLVGAQVVALAHFTSRSFFVYDDFIYLRQAQRRGLSLRFLAQPLNLHFSPAHRFVDWLIERAFPLNFGVAQLLLLACFAASLILLHEVLAELFGHGPGPLVLTVLYGTSLVQVGVAQWWASGLQSLPSTVLSLAAILAYLRYHRNGSRRMLVVSSMAFTVGLLFYIKPLLVPLYIFLLRVLVLDPGRTVRESLAAVAREWRTWALYLAPAMVYVAGYAVWYWHSSGTSSPGAIGRYLEISWGRAFLPDFVGFAVAPGPMPTTAAVAVLAVQAGLLMIVGWSVVRHPRAWRAWAFFVAVFVANGLATGLVRLGTFGPDVAYSYRYWMEAAYLLPVALGAAFLGFPKRPGAMGRLASQISARPWWRTVAWSAASVAMAAHLVLVWSSADHLSRQWAGHDAGLYMGKVRSQLRYLAQLGIRPTIVDGAVPDSVMPAWMAYGADVPYNRYSELFPLLGGRLQFDRPSPNLFRVGSDGTLARVAFVPQAGGETPGLLQTGALKVTMGTAETSGNGVCVRSALAPGSVEFTPSAAHDGDDWYAQVLYRSDIKTNVTAYIDRGSGFTYMDQRSVTVAHPGAGAALVPLGGPGVVRLRLEIPPRSRLCLDNLELGPLTEPGTPSSGSGGAVDPFDRDDSASSLGHTPSGVAWHAESGTWGIASGQAVVYSPGEGADFATVGAAWPDCVVQVRLTKVAPYAGLVFRYRDPANYWAVVAAPAYSTWVIVRVADGQTTQMGNTGLVSTGDGTTVGARMRGATVDILVDGKIMTTVASPPSPGADKVGLTADGADATHARFDDFSVVPEPAP